MGRQKGGQSVSHLHFAVSFTTSTITGFSFLSSTTTSKPRSSFTALAAILTIGTFLLFRRLTAPLTFHRDVSPTITVVRSGHGREMRRHGMQRLCNVVSNSLGSGDRRTSTSRREYQLLVTNPLSPFLRLHIHHSLTYGRHVLRSGLTLISLKVSHARRVLRLMCAFFVCLRCALSCSPYSIIPSFPGDFFTPAFQCPHRVERVGTLGDGGTWTCGLDRVAKQKQCVIYLFGLSLPSSILRWLTAR